MCLITEWNERLKNEDTIDIDVPTEIDVFVAVPVYKYCVANTADGYDHTNMTAPLPVRSAKLSMFGPG